MDKDEEKSSNFNKYEIVSKALKDILNNILKQKLKKVLQEPLISDDIDLVYALAIVG